MISNFHKKSWRKSADSDYSRPTLFIQDTEGQRGYIQLFSTKHGYASGRYLVRKDTFMQIFYAVYLQGPELIT